MRALAELRGFVGRVEELDRLEGVLRLAAEGRPSVVLVGGDAGVGKTRLVEEFTVRARGKGARVLTGGCLELGDGGLPYGAITEALRGLAEELGRAELRRLAGEDARELQRLMPGVRPADEPDGAGAVGLDASSQLRLFEAVLGLIGRLAAEMPLVIVLEDVQWADTSTRDLLVFLAHNLREAGVMVAVTYRTDGLHRGHPLWPVLARLVRDETVERIDLAPFDRDEMALLLQGILGEAPGLELLERVLERSQGNAFFAEELLAAGEAQGAVLPDSLRDILLVTIDTLPPEVVEVMRVVAAAGGTARHGLVAQVVASGGGEPDSADLDGVLRVAVDQGVLVVDAAAGSYAFRHALLAEAVYSTLLPGELGRLHTALATAIEADPELAFRSAAAELAVHWGVAKDRPRALSASLEAAREAEAVAGVAEARRHVERVLQLWPQVEDAEKRTGLERTAVTQWAAELSHLLGDPERAVVLQEQALGEETGDDPVQQAMLLERLGRFHWAASDDERAEVAYAEALRRVPEEPPSAEQARVLSGYSQFLQVSLRYDESDRYGRQALAMAREVGARAVEGSALNTLGANLGRGGDEGGLELLREARAIAEELGASEDIIRSYHTEAVMLGHFGRFDEAIEVGLEGLERARALGLERRSAVLSYVVAMGAFYAGRWQLADEVLRAAPRGTGGIGAGWPHLVRADLSAARGEAGLARDELAAAERFHAHVNEQTRNRFVTTQLMLALLDGDAEQAQQLLAARPPTLDPLTIQSLVARAYILRALADLNVSDAHDSPLPDRVLAECHDLASKLGAGTALVAAWRVLAEAEHARAVGASDRAERWTASVARCEEFGMIYYAAYARFRLAQALLDDGVRDDVADLLRSAHEVARDLAAQPLVDDLVALARRARIDLGTKTATTPAKRLGLTPREIEVLALVADGRTNPEISAELYISVKTASVHVSNILRKLEVSNRGEAAALAHRHGLTTE